MEASVLEDLDLAETQEWIDALDSVLAFEGADRAFHLLDEVVTEARRKGAPVPYSATTPYLKTIPPDEEDRHPARVSSRGRPAAARSPSDGTRA
jgi:pyruvate dehydrogenase E1 component